MLEYHARGIIVSTEKHNAAVIISPWKVYCYLSERGSNVIREWLDAEKIGAGQRAKFQAKIDALESGGPDLNPGLLSDTPVAKDIYKMKIKGNKGQVQLRPMVCKGPYLMNQEFTILHGAVEKDKKLVPADVKARAQANRASLLKDEKRRRHERVI
jgi:hypothetical protein